MPTREWKNALSFFSLRKTRSNALRLWLPAILMIAIGPLAHGAIPTTERAVLTALYVQTNGDGWANSTNWNGAAGTECTWIGITCDSQQTHVVSISLRDNLLVGTLPRLDDLVALQTFDVSTSINDGALFCNGEFSYSCNTLTGAIPPLSQLTSLQTFKVSENSFTGSIPSLSGLDNLQTFEAYQNKLGGTIPSLTGLKSLLIFKVNGNSLIGTIPALSGLSQLLIFNVCTNQLSGSLPALSGLVNLRLFYACDNDLTGSIPSFEDLGRIYFYLQIDISNNRLGGTIPSLVGMNGLDFAAENNQLTGPIPALPPVGNFNASNNQLNGSIPSLSGQSFLTNFEVRSNQLTGSIPSLDGLDNLGFIDVSNNNLTGSLPNLAGARELLQFDAANNQLTGAIPDLSANIGLQSFDVSNNQLTGPIPSIGASNMRLFSVGFNKLTGSAPPAVVDPAYGQGYDSSLCPNQLTHSASAGWDTATRVSPWYRDCVEDFVNLDQVGLTGTWYSPPTSGQGFSLQIFPDISGAGHGFLSAGWMTYSGETPPYGQRWYSLQGEVDSASSTATVAIGQPASPGTFAAPPRVPLERVGMATIAFSDCNHGTLSYSFFDSNIVASPIYFNSPGGGMIPLTRLTPNTNCTQQGGNGIPGSDSLLSGNWYDPASSGQGLIFDIAPGDNALFAIWFTYDPGTPDAAPTFRNERWYTLQSGAVAAGSTSLHDIPIFYTSDGEFDTPGRPPTIQVGAADITFQSCTAMTFKYNLNQIKTGTINLVRLGPAPTGCSL